jgi:hypothetical protein
MSILRHQEGEVETSRVSICHKYPVSRYPMTSSLLNKRFVIQGDERNKGTLENFIKFDFPDPT